jgi:hypothetical protein
VLLAVRAACCSPPSRAPDSTSTTLEKLTKHIVTDVRQFREIIAGVRRPG